MIRFIPLYLVLNFEMNIFFSLFPEQVAVVVNFFNISYHHVTLFVAPGGEVLPSHLLGVVVLHIAIAENLSCSVL